MDIKLLCVEDVTEKEFNKTLKKLKNMLPNDFIEFIRNANGAYISPNTIMVNDHEEMVNNLVSMGSKSEAYILDYKEAINNKSIIPFARDAGDNYYAFWFTDDDYKVVFWDSDLETYEPFCQSFTEFLSLLY